MNRKIILVDQDGVLANYQARLIEMLASQHPEIPIVPIEELHEHDTDKNYAPKYRERIEAITLSRGFYRSLSPINGGKEALEHMLQLGHDVRICTAPKRDFRNCVLEKLEWIDEHLGRKWAERTIITRDKTLVRGDVLIDDKPNITGAQHPVWTHVFYDQPYNRRFTATPRLTWKNYQEILTL